MNDAPFSVVPDYWISNLVEYAERAPFPGAFVEVGVYRGGTAWHLAKVAEQRGCPIFLYDTFTGIPYKDEIDFHTPGDFDDTSADEVRKAIPYATVIEGLFPDSIVPMPAVAFAHIDVDQYRSIIETVNVLESMMLPGGFMIFDDFGCLDGATRAVLESFPPERIKITEAGKALVKF